MHIKTIVQKKIKNNNGLCKFTAPHSGPTRKVQLIFSLDTHTKDRIATRVQKIVVKAATRVQIKKKN